MTLTEHTAVEQGSDAWLELRRGMVTASTLGQLITPKTIKPANNPESRRLVMQLAAERLTGWTDPNYVSDDMMRGHDEEPIARALYAEHVAPVAETGFMVRDDWGFEIGASPDGLVGDDGLLEIKSRRSKKHVETVVADEVPVENVAQCQCALLVSGRQWLDYVSYCSGLELWVKRVYPDPAWQAAIVEAARAAEAAITRIVATYRANATGRPMTERRVELEVVI